MKYPVVELLQVVSDDSEKRTFRDNSTGSERTYLSRTISGITSCGALCVVSVPERYSPSISVEIGSPATLPCGRIEVERGVWKCVAAARS